MHGVSVAFVSSLAQHWLRQELISFHVVCRLAERCTPLIFSTHIHTYTQAQTHARTHARLSASTSAHHVLRGGPHTHGLHHTSVRNSNGGGGVCGDDGSSSVQQQTRFIAAKLITLGDHRQIKVTIARLLHRKDVVKGTHAVTNTHHVE